MDPLYVIPLELHNLIFQHLSGMDVIRMSEVSIDWHERTAKKTETMKKIKLSMKCNSRIKKEEFEEKLEVLRNSIRDYRAITIHCQFEKSLSEEFWRFLKSRSSIVEELKIKSIRLDLDPLPIRLENLRILKLTFVSIVLRNVLISSSQKLTKLKLKLVSPVAMNSQIPVCDRESSEIMKKCQQMNPDLEELELHGGIQYFTFFSHPFKDKPTFQLKSLKLKTNARLSMIPEFIEINLINFLKTQSASLKKFFIDVCRQNIIQHVFNEMTHLSHLHLDTMLMFEYQVNELNLRTNERLEDLRIPYVNQPDDLIEFLNLSPNLKFLFISHLFPEAMAIIATQLMQLRTLKFRYEERDCETYYERLKRNPNVNSDIDLIWDYEYS